MLPGATATPAKQGRLDKVGVVPNRPVAARSAPVATVRRTRAQHQISHSEKFANHLAHKDLRRCLSLEPVSKFAGGPVFGQRAGWRDATREHTPSGL